MAIGSLAGIAGHYLESLFSGSTGAPSSASQAAPFAEILDNVQDLAQSNASQYQQAMQKISGNLQTAAQSAAANGQTGLAADLTNLSGDLKNVSVNWQLPNISSLSQTIGY